MRNSRALLAACILPALIFCGAGYLDGDVVFFSMGSLLMGIGFGALDPDAGGYVDRPRLAKDKIQHFAIAMLLAIGVGAFFAFSPKLVVWYVTLAGVGYEKGQGFIAKYDIAYDVAGAALGAVLLVTFGRIW